MAKKKISNQDYSKLTLQLLKVLLLRHRGVENAIKAEAISPIMGGMNPVTTREIVGLLTAQGFWCCSGNDGYWYALSERAWKEDQLDKERNRGIAIIKKTVEAKKNSVNEPTLFELEAT